MSLMSAGSRFATIVSPGDTNHHGTLFGGVALAYMDKVAFITAVRKWGADFVTASCERIDFHAPCRLGDIVELEGRVKRVGRRSLQVEVELAAQNILTAKRTISSVGTFNMVAIGDRKGDGTESSFCENTAHTNRIVDLILPDRTSHDGNFCNGQALSAMASAAFVEASRQSRRMLKIVGSRDVRFEHTVHAGSIIEMAAAVGRIDVPMIDVDVTLWSGRPGDVRPVRCAHGTFELTFAARDDQSPDPSRLPIPEDGVHVEAG